MVSGSTFVGWGKVRFHIYRGVRHSDVLTASHFLFNWLKNWLELIGAAEIRKENCLTWGQQDGSLLVKLCNPFRHRVLFLAMMNKPVRNPTSSFSLNMFNKIDTVSECAWVSVTNVPESSFSQRAESYAHRLEAVKTALGYRLNSWWWLVSWSIGSCVCVLTWLTEQWDSSGLLYRITSFVPKGSILMMSPNVLPSGVSFQQVSWGRGYDSAVLNSFSTV